MPSVQRKSANILLMIGSFIAAALLAELVLRQVLGGNFALFPRFHAAVQYGPYTLRRSQPGAHFTHTSVDGRWTFTINSQGFRDDVDYAYPKPNGVLRVLALGDSHTIGYESAQDRTYSKVIERQLAKRNIRAQVINAGVSGFSTAEELVFLEHEGFKYNPDVVVLGFYRNDFEDNLKSNLFTIDNGALVEANRAFIPGVRALGFVNSVPGTVWLSQHSYLYSLGFNTAWDVAKRALLDKARADALTEYAIPTQDLDDKMKRLGGALIDRLHAVTQARGTPLIILDIPATTGLETFVTSVLEELRSAFKADSERLILSEDVLGAYQGLATFHRPHGNWHINEFSHMLFGMAAADAIIELKGL
jgi:hypothetical protein